jgi:hypothetical protein
LWSALLCSALLGGSGRAAIADTTIAQTNQPTPVSAYGGVVAWSVFTSGAYHLMVSIGGLATPVPTPSEPQAFDASVGPDQSNHIVVLFSRCRHYRSEPSHPLFGDAASGCRIYTYSLSRRAVLPLAFGGGVADSFTHPSQWRSRVAVVHSTTSGRAWIEVISLPIRKRIELRRGTLRAAGVDSLQLVGSHLSAGWYASAGLETEIVLGTLSGAQEVLQESTSARGPHSASLNPTGPELFAAGLAGDEAYWVAAGDRLIGTPSVLNFYNFFTHTTSTEDAPPDVFSVALDGKNLYYSTGTEAGGCPCEVFKR